MSGGEMQMSGNGDLVPFVFPETNRPIRFVVRDNLAWPVLTDVCRELGTKNTWDVVRRLPESAIGTVDDFLDPSGISVVIHPYRGLPRVIMWSRSNVKDRLESWIFDEVLPRIFETGSYVSTPTTYLEALEAAAATERQRIALASKVAELTPKARAHDAFIEPEGWIPNREAAKILYGATSEGPVKLLNKLGDLKVLYRSSEGNWLPYQDPWVGKQLMRSHRVPGTGRARGRLFPEVQYSPRGLVAVYYKLLRAGEDVRDPTDALGDIA